MDDFQYSPSNREKSRAPKKGLWWCDSCDRALVGQGKKCPVCRNIQGGKKRLKKETNA